MNVIAYYEINRFITIEIADNFTDREITYRYYFFDADYAKSWRTVPFDGESFVTEEGIRIHIADCHRIY